MFSFLRYCNSTHSQAKGDIAKRVEAALPRLYSKEVMCAGYVVYEREKLLLLLYLIKLFPGGVDRLLLWRLWRTPGLPRDHATRRVEVCYL